MKSKLVLTIMFVLASINLFSQDYFLYVSTSRENLKPNIKEKGMANDELLNQIFKEFKVESYYQSFPGAKNIELQSYYEIHFKGNVDSLENLLKERKIFDAIYRCDYYKPAGCSSPVPINDPFPGITSKIALDLLDAQCAWNITKGDPNIIVGVVDTEFELNHEDLVNTFVGTVGTRTDPQVHGTYVSSAVATGTNNGIGIAAIGYNTKVRGYYVNGRTVWNGIWQAYLDGIKIINVSWGGIGTPPNVLGVQEMTSNGVVLVFAAGNIIPDHNLCHQLYANIPGVINVSGVDANNNHGPTGVVHNDWVDVCALARSVPFCRPGTVNEYGVTSGTSLAAPQVAGVAALMRSINNNLSSADIENIIKATADPIADANQFPGQLGAGRVNAYKAVKQVLCMLPNKTFSKNVTADETIFGSDVTITNTTINTGKKLIVTACNKITITNNVIVNSGGTLILNAKEVDIDPTFEVASDAEFEINIIE